MRPYKHTHKQTNNPLLACCKIKQKKKKKKKKDKRWLNDLCSQYSVPQMMDCIY